VTVPFIIRTTSASISQLDPALNDSSQSLGASWFYTMRRVTLPLIAPGIFAVLFAWTIDTLPGAAFLLAGGLLAAAALTTWLVTARTRPAARVP